MEVKAEYLAIFNEEAGDQLREWEESLLALEKSPGDREHINGMFRAIHTLKGSAGFIGFDSLQKVAHDLESSLSDVREGTLAWNGDVGDILFKGLDLCKTMIEAFAAGKVPEVDIEGFLATLERIKSGSPASPKATASPSAPPAPVGAAEPATAPAGVPAPNGGAVTTCRLSVRIEGQPREAYLRSFLVKARLDRLGRILATDPAPEVLRDGEGPFVYTVTFETGKSPESVAEEVAIDQVSISLVVPPAVPAPAAPVPVSEEAAVAAAKEAHEQFSRSGKPEEVVRVSVQKLDTLLNLVGELVIYNSGFAATAQSLREEYGRTKFILDLEEKTEALSGITRELQDGIMKARMLPIANVFNRFRRVVRDLAKASGKTVVFDVFGEETEIDKKVIDRIGEPLVHLVRNAVDHGLEPVEQRVKRGKSPQGTIRLGAYQDGDHICVEVSDDGRGLDRDAILRKALEKGLIRPEEVASASMERILGFIFLPGFSTARTVSDISGRGVGMDAVKRAVDEMSGNVRVRSSAGAGTTVTISLPLTMAIITAVLVEVGGSIYAIPLSAVREILKEKDSILKTVGTRRVIMLRDEVLALVNLGAALENTASKPPAATGAGLPVVVVDFEGRKIGLEVEKLHGTREVVIKSLSRHYREVEGLIGASILGNGKIALIVDVETMIGLHYHHGNGRVSSLRGAAFDFIESKEPAGATPMGQPASQASDIDLVPVELPAGPASPPPEAAPVSVPQAAGRDSTAGDIEDLARMVAGSRGRVLEAVHNAGAIQASISLSQLMGQEIRVSFPESRLVPLRDVAELMGGEEVTVGGIYVGVGGDITGGVLLVFPEKNLLAIDDMLHGKPAGTVTDISQVDLSGLSEMGNILACCFINAFADSDGLAASAEVPEISIDMCLPVIDSVLARFNQPGDKILLTEAVIYGGDAENVVCHQILFLEPDSLRKLMDTLAAESAAVVHAPASDPDASATVQGQVTE
jgi:two-component system chemotaxis sensor kinase CheA